MSFLSSKFFLSNLKINKNFKFFSSLSTPLPLTNSFLSLEENKTPILNNFPKQSMTPSEVVSYLDQYIIGQKDAKKAVAIAFRNRWRRQQLPIDIKNEVILTCFCFVFHSFSLFFHSVFTLFLY